MNILFVTPECAPLVKTGGLGDVSAALPRALAALGHDVRVLMPAYGHMQARGELTGHFVLPAFGPWPAAQLLQLERPGTAPMWLLSCPELYARGGSPYGEAAGPDHADNARRFGMLSRVAAWMGTAATPCGWQADIVHGNDWPCGLAPLFLRHARVGATTPVARSIMTVHNLAFQGLFPMDACDSLGIPAQDRGIDGVEFWGQASMLKAGLQFADAITTVSPTYAHEIQQADNGFGLDGVLLSRRQDLHGILNGIDTQVWNPATDKLIAARYSAADLSGKAANKTALQAHCELQPTRNRMLFGLVGRLTDQKGVDLVARAAPAIVQGSGQLVVLGAGDTALQDALRDAAAAHPGQVSVTLGFDETLAHQIEAGADAFLMPSRFEPCGLNQMYSQAYGTPPIVAPVGGLRDSVTDAADGGGGFVMASHDQAAFGDAIVRATNAWRDTGTWRAVQRAGMAREFAWDAPARRYASLYENLLNAAP
ncbi:glycogen synthase GlgA [Hydrogenophaga sp. BPS33]|uniref:glycogen synthase GlgA n=1 Tax=Hydrogenophaga sp. BPS33 TaxID=2651974 RepID=UPI001320330F|nr:glycogen synthase GlgA [Hydrogenophaga sp. BPS33]QHE86642.1 glycogen synthase GlgA [Hydrogenophaga sp. BPS33]